MKRDEDRIAQWRKIEEVRRLCATCRHAPMNPPAGYPMPCLHPLSPRFPSGVASPCVMMRSDIGPCGRDGKLWELRERWSEDRPPWPARVHAWAARSWRRLRAWWHA